MNEGAPERQLVRRVNFIMAALGAIGVVAAAVAWGLAGAIGFAAGAVVAFLNFRWMANMVSALGTPNTRRISTILLGGRYLLLAAIGYVIFRYSEVGFLARRFAIR